MSLADLGAVAEANPVCRMAPWSVQNDRTKDQGSYDMGAPDTWTHGDGSDFTAEDLTNQHTKNCRWINRAVFLSAIPVVHVVAVVIFAAMAYKVGESEYRNHLIGMAITTAVVGFIPLAMLAVFGIGTGVQYIICRPPVLNQLRATADAFVLEADGMENRGAAIFVVSAANRLREAAAALSDSQARMPEAVALSEAIQAAFAAREEHGAQSNERMQASAVVVERMDALANALPGESAAANAVRAAHGALRLLQH